MRFLFSFSRLPRASTLTRRLPLRPALGRGNFVNVLPSDDRLRGYTSVGPWLETDSTLWEK
ncbi:protein of unknown function [Methylocaldum szegediense]|uniref:Uncharacterized protein n=1 Tax=Methylocaldum szegediense TaxID=73780 RepID=A0ABM9HWK5_9GAMM|nr:protein of unknown function [Methylocaldum szegediense]